MGEERLALCAGHMQTTTKELFVLVPSPPSPTILLSNSITMIFSLLHNYNGVMKYCIVHSRIYTSVFARVVLAPEDLEYAREELTSVIITPETSALAAEETARYYMYFYGLVAPSIWPWIGSTETFALNTWIFIIRG